MVPGDIPHAAAYGDTMQELGFAVFAADDGEHTAEAHSPWHPKCTYATHVSGMPCGSSHPAAASASRQVGQNFPTHLQDFCLRSGHIPLTASFYYVRERNCQ